MKFLLATSMVMTMIIMLTAILNDNEAILSLLMITFPVAVAASMIVLYNESGE